jgi:glutamate/tyrosine decarboxylase-like PLP-dependent enzyme
MLNLGKDGYRAIAADIFRTADEVKHAVRAHPELALIGDSRFMAAFRANPDVDEPIDIFHVNDSLIASGWRMNGLQLPPALHFCITKPNTQPGVTEAFAADLTTAVAYASQPPTALPRSGSMYGSGGRAVDADRAVAGMTAWLDAVHEVGPLDS